MNINLDMVLVIQSILCVHAEVQTTEHFPLRCRFCSTQKLKLLKNLEKIDPHFLSLGTKNQVFILSYNYRVLCSNHCKRLT